MLNNNRGASKVDTLIKLVLIFFISLFSFAVGTFLGKKFSDKQHRIAQIEREYGKSSEERSVASISPHSTDIKPKTALSEADINSISEEFSQAETDEMKKVIAEAEAEIAEQTGEANAHDPNVANAHNTHAAEPANPHHTEKNIHAKAVAQTQKHAQVDTHHNNAHAETSNTKHDSTRAVANTDAVAKVAQRVAQGQIPVPVEKKVPSRIPNTLPPKVSSSVAQFTVQIASYQSEAEAAAHAESLVNKGHKAFHFQAKVNSQIWYRVGIGTYVSQSIANDSLRALLKTQEIKSGFVTKVVQ